MERKTYLNRYRLCVDRIGMPVFIRRSADEATLQADDIESGGRVAVQLEPAAAFDASEREQLEAEARAAKQIDHINIPVLRDFGFDNNQLVYVTEYLEGVTAEDWVKTKGPMPASAVLRIGSQVVSALGAASFHGITHYAVYPGNIMLVPGENGRGEWPLVKVLNLLGMAPSLPLPGTNGSTLLNPADFASPEQLKDGPLDFRSEIYSLGCTLWYLLKGQPFSGDAAAIQDASGLAAPVRQLLAEMLAENPDERPFDRPVFQKKIQDCIAQIERQDVVPNNFGSSTSDTPALAPVNEIALAPRRHSARERLALAAILIAIATLVALVWQQRVRQQFAAEVSAIAPEAPEIASAAEPQTDSEAAKEPPALTANVVESAEKNEQPSSNKTVSGEAEASAQTVAGDASLATPQIEMMASAPTERDSAEPVTPVVASNSSSTEPGIAAMSPTQVTPEDPSLSIANPEIASRVLPEQESPEQTAPVVASNSSSFAPEIAAIQAAAEQLPITMDALPPAEGPIESEKPTAGNSPAQTNTPKEEVRQDTPTSPQVAAKKISKPEHVAESSKKKKPGAAGSHSPAPVAVSLSRRQYSVATVGHILFPVRPADHPNDAKPAPSTSAVVSSQPRPNPVPAVGHIFPASPEGHVSQTSSSREKRHNSRRPVRASVKKSPASSAVPSA